MRPIAPILIFFTLLSFNIPVTAQPVKIWEINNVYKAPESVAYDKQRDVIYVSNYTESIKNGGFYGRHSVSKAKPNGEIIKYDWINGLTSPTGVDVNNDKLYIAERFGIVEYDLKADKISNKYYIKTTGFLNDVSTDDEGNIYVSASDTNIIYRIHNGDVEIWLEDDDIFYTNGVLVDGDKLILGVNSDSCLKSADLKTREVETVASLGKGYIDGIEKCGTGYLVTFFEGKLLFVDSSGKVTELLNTVDEGTNMADLEYIEDKGLIIIPALWNNKLIGYEYKIK